MRTRRVLLITLALVLAAATSGTAVIALFLYPLPEPALADRQALLRWVVTRDLAEETLETRQVLAGRLEEEFGEAVEWEAAAKRLSAGQRERIWRNLLALVEPWFLGKAQRYDELSPREQAAYLDRVLEKVKAWRGAAVLCNQHSGEAGTAKHMTTILLEKVEEAKSRATPTQRQRLDAFLLALQTRWLLRTFSTLVPTVSS